MEFMERIWCKLFHVWDDYESMYQSDKMDKINEASNYITRFCPICQKYRFKLKSKSRLKLLIEWNK